MKKDQWGLVDCNDPDVIFTITARPNPFWNLTTEEADLLPKELSDIDYEWLVSAEKFSEEFWMGIEAPRLSLHICSRFMLQALEHGFDPKSRHRNKSQFELWLFQKLGEYMFTHSTPITDNSHKEETLADGIST